ncbi:MAG: GHKL domain-containing protein [Chitinophagaceae bacterium]|nr:GHKL domain-containing protein [Chitinophagaceae bacterium]
MLVSSVVFSQVNPVVINDTIKEVEVKGHAFEFKDSSGKLSEAEILQPGVKWINTKETPVYQVTTGNIWTKFTIINNSSTPSLFINLQYANITKLTCYRLINNTLLQIDEMGNAFPFQYRKALNPDFVFNVNIPKNTSETYFLKIFSEHPLLLPVFVVKEKQLQNILSVQTIIIGIYVGILMALFFYNFFLFLSTKDRSYLAYILFLFFLGMAQLTVSGHAYKYLWPNSPQFNRYALTLTSALAGIAGIYFGMFFLLMKQYLPIARKCFIGLIAIYMLSILFSLAGNNYISYYLLNLCGTAGGVSLLAASIYIASKGYKPAYFYVVAWVIFLVGIVILSLRNSNLLPYNNFTTYILYAGSAIEVILLSIALADKINVLRKEKEISQMEALRASRENEKLVREQNILLERKVSERTEELQSANTQLNEAYSVLKDAQIQLVEAEKMASLGQLTAGIAHEINNPINFVKSNIKPLLLDLGDLFTVIDEYGKLHQQHIETIPVSLKNIQQLQTSFDMDFLRKEIYSLMKGIEDGADRTAEIVRGLRNFSRLDESLIKTVNIHEGLDSTLVILRNLVPENVSVIKNFHADGEIECFPGKLNQVFMNILNNSIQAVKLQNSQDQQQIIVTTKDLENDSIEISIKDTGPGMSLEVKQKIFDPFFTTKEVGEGTGLGLAIVFRIIQEHHGKIQVVSSEGQGAEFIITLLRIIPDKAII